MLVQLTISNFAIIRHLEISLGSGLNILSGETGAGKSIIINAVNLILGGRASTDIIRSGCKEARVEALFSLPENRALNETLEAYEIPFEGELLVKRSVFREGRNKIFINGSVATLQMLSTIGSLLISISGQHEHQLLLRPERHLYLLDDFAGLAEERGAFREIYGRYRSLKEEMVKLEKEIREMVEKQELTEFQIKEIEEANMMAGEDKALGEERKRLQHSKELLEIASDGYQILYERNDSLLSVISQYMRKIEKGVEIDPSLDPVKNALSEIEVKLEDTSLALRDFQKNINMDSRKLEEVEERLELLNRLKRKYGPTLDDVFRFKEELSSEMYNLDEKKERLGKLEGESKRLEAEVLERASALSLKRKEAALKLENDVEEELQNLHMKYTRFQVKMNNEGDMPGGVPGTTIDSMGVDGGDNVEFMISPNIGEELRPLSKIASGGELSRIMLAMKSILARTASVESIVFDEVDSGISGATAEVVGEKLLSLADYHQILCITHLAQIVSQGQTHFLVKKEVVEGRTQTVISELDSEERVQEIARLLGGKEVTPQAVAHAREMLG
jgi:DNA repair protein RecN (Recombination protein N)